MSEHRNGGTGEVELAPMPEAWLEAIAERAATILGEQLLKAATLRFAARQRSEYLTVAETAELLRAKRQRVYDLLSAGRLTRYKDGSRVLIKRAELEAHLAGERPRRVADALPPDSRSRARSGGAT